MSEAIVFRRARPEDARATYDVFLAAVNELRARAGRPEAADTPARFTRALAFRQHALAHDPDGFWVAEADGQVVGFGIATLRQRLWYLAALHVLPPYQGKGVGRDLLMRCLATGARRGIIRTVFSEAGQPVSNALYAKHGMYQWVPLLHLAGPAACLAATADLTAEAVSADGSVFSILDAIDTAVLGITRTIDHQLWLSLPDMTGLLFSRQGEAVGYAYVSTFGGIGPVAVRSPRFLPAVLTLSLRAADERGVDHVSLVVPGLCRSGLAYLLANGFRYGEGINLVLASRPFGHLDRYLISAGDALI